MLARGCIVGVFFASLLTGSAQQPSHTIDDSAAEVQGALLELRAGLYTGFAQKRLGRMGDEAAEAVIRTHALEELNAEPMAIAVVEVIATSFNSPTLIAKESNKIPKMSVLLISYLRPFIHTPAGVRLVDETSEMLKQQTDSQAQTKPKT